MSIIDRIHKDRYDTPKVPFSLDINDLNNFKYDMEHCIKCKGCYWVDHTYMPGVKNGVRCPSNLWKEFDSYGAFGKMRIGLKVNEDQLEWTDHLLELIYADPLCGACDVGCKRNLDLEIGLSMEALRVKAIKDGAAPLPPHKKIVENINKRGNYFGAEQSPMNWITPEIQVTEDAETLFFVGCSSAYVNQNIARSAAMLMNAAQVPFTVMNDETCCGNTLFSIGMIEEAKKIAQDNINKIVDKKAKVLVTACAECYRMWKVDYPKLLGIHTEELPFKVLHIIELAYDAYKKGDLKFNQSVPLQITYHDSCGVSRLCDPWEPYEGTRGWMGTIEPGLQRRRGRSGLYEITREMLDAIPDLQLKEMPRTRENALCCAGGRGTVAAFPELSGFAADERLKEAKSTGAERLVAACPWCYSNLSGSEGVTDSSIGIMDISELLLAAAEK